MFKSILIKTRFWKLINMLGGGGSQQEAVELPSLLTTTFGLII